MPCEGGFLTEFHNLFRSQFFFQISCKANQWAGFYTIVASVIKELFKYSLKTFVSVLVRNGALTQNN